jgi:hypothetical protein
MIRAVFEKAASNPLLALFYLDYIGISVTRKLARLCAGQEERIVLNGIQLDIAFAVRGQVLDPHLTKVLEVGLGVFLDLLGRFRVIVERV